VEEGEWEVGKGEGDIDAVTTVVGEGGAKIEGSVPVRVPRETVVGVVKRKTKLAGDEWGGRRSRREDGEDQTKQRGKDRGAKGA
jgi:hypothetical protein